MEDRNFSNGIIEVDTLFLKQALQLAEQAKDEGEVPVGAVITYQGSIIAKGYNQTEKLQDPTAHAEMLAITAANIHFGAKYLKHCTLYVTLEPCPMCAGAIALAQISRLVYSSKDPKKGYSTFSPCILHSKTDVSEGNLSESASILLKDFFKSKR